MRLEYEPAGWGRQMLDKSRYWFNRRLCNQNMAHIRRSRPDYGLGFQVKVLKIFQVVPSSIGNGPVVRLLTCGEAGSSSSLLLLIQVLEGP